MKFFHHDPTDPHHKHSHDEKATGGAKEALKRDVEQTKSDLPGLKGKDLDQNAADTVKQATGKDKH